jgi:hypothetical protein
MQEIYNELVEQRNTAIRIQNKMLTMMKEPEDMTLIGPVIEKQQKIINDCVEKKLTLSKLQSTMWEKSNTAGSGSFSITDLGVDDDLLENFPFAKTKERWIKEEIGEENYNIMEQIKRIQSYKGVQARMPFEITIQ